MITLEQMVHRRRVVAQSRRRHRSRPLPLATPPRGAIVQHTALLQGISRELDAAIHDELAGLGVVPARADAADGDAAPRVNPDAVAARLRRLVAKILQRKQLVTALDGVAASVAAHTREQFQRQVRAALGIDLPASNPDFSRVFRDFRTKNTALIKTMAEDKVGRVRRVLHEAGVGTRVEEIAAALQEQTGITDRHAALVARDQVLKLNGQVTEQRHQEAGVTQYIWRTSEDERVRESHRALDGTKHRYDQPPVQSAKGEKANPGQFFQCRCTMEPVIEGFDEEFAPGQQYAHGTASPVLWSPRAAAGRGAQQAPRERRAPPDEGSDGPQTVAAPEMPGRAIPAPSMVAAHPESAPPSAALNVRPEPAQDLSRPGSGEPPSPPTRPPSGGGPASGGGDDDEWKRLQGELKAQHGVEVSDDELARMKATGARPVDFRRMLTAAPPEPGRTPPKALSVKDALQVSERPGDAGRHAARFAGHYAQTGARPDTVKRAIAEIAQHGVDSLELAARAADAGLDPKGAHAMTKRPPTAKSSAALSALRGPGAPTFSGTSEHVHEVVQAMEVARREGASHVHLHPGKGGDGFLRRPDGQEIPISLKHFVDTSDAGTLFSKIEKNAGRILEVGGAAVGTTDVHIDSSLSVSDILAAYNDPSVTPDRRKNRIESARGGVYSRVIVTAPDGTFIVDGAGPRIDAPRNP